MAIINERHFIKVIYKRPKDEKIQYHKIILYLQTLKTSYKSTQTPSTFFLRVFGHIYEQILQHTNMNSVHF